MTLDDVMTIADELSFDSYSTHLQAITKLRIAILAYGKAQRERCAALVESNAEMCKPLGLCQLVVSSQVGAIRSLGDE